MVSKIKSILAILFIAVISLSLYCTLSFDECFFFYRFMRNPAQTGSITPTSNRVAQELIAPLLRVAPPRRILEVGAGTGPVTHMIAEHIAPDDVVDVLEIDPAMCKLLKERFAQYDQMHISCVAAQHWAPEYRYDVIITTIPFNNLPVGLVVEILAAIERLIKPDGVISYIEYVGGRWLKGLTTFGDAHKEVQKRMAVLDELQARYNANRVTIFANVPPTYVYHLR